MVNLLLGERPSTFSDDGCDLHPACLTCPFAKCRYDVSHDGRKLAKEVRDSEVIGIAATEGLDARELGQRFGVSKRTAYRILERGRSARGRIAA